MPITSLYTKSGLINWDGKDDSGNIVPQGVYIILTQSGTTDKAGFVKCTIKYR
jgi:flagellar hook assembly protein FlgD